MSDRSTEQVPAVNTTDAEETVSTVQAPKRQEREELVTGPAAADVTAFWDQLDAELALLPAAPEAEASSLLSTEHSTTYQVKLSSTGPYRIQIFLSVPKGDGPFPALMLVPGYGSVVTPPVYNDRMRYVAMSVRYRGTRHADWPYAAQFPGLLTDGIDDPLRWKFRGIFADLFRSYEYLTSLSVVDKEHVAVNGSDWGVLVAARRAGVTTLSVTAPFFYRLAELYPRTEAYPFEEINDYLRSFLEQRQAINHTLSYFDPLFHAGRVTADTLVSLGDAGAPGGPEWMAPLIDALGGQVDQYPMTHEGQTDYDAVDDWIARRQGVEPRPRSWRPQEIGPWSAT